MTTFHSKLTNVCRVLWWKVSIFHLGSKNALNIGIQPSNNKEIIFRHCCINFFSCTKNFNLKHDEWIKSWPLTSAEHTLKNHNFACKNVSFMSLQISVQEYFSSCATCDLEFFKVWAPKNGDVGLCTFGCEILRNLLWVSFFFFPQGNFFLLKVSLVI